MGNLFGKSAAPKPVENAAPVTKVAPWDAVNMKRILDETVAKSLEFQTPIRESMTYGNIKLIVMTLASISALVAQFYPIPFPLNRILLGLCALIYFGLSGVLQFMTTFLDGDIIYKGKTTPPKTEGGAAAAATAGTNSKTNNSNTNKSTSFPGNAPTGTVIVLRTQMLRFDDNYTIIAECPPGVEVARCSRSVGMYFTASGEFAENIVEKDVETYISKKLFGDAVVTATVAANTISSSNNNDSSSNSNNSNSSSSATKSSTDAAPEINGSNPTIKSGNNNGGKTTTTTEADHTVSSSSGGGTRQRPHT